MKKGVKNGTTRLVIDTTRLTNLVYEPTIATTGYTWPGDRACDWWREILFRDGGPCSPTAVLVQASWAQTMRLQSSRLESSPKNLLDG